MTKKTLKTLHWLNALALIMMASFAFVACGDDDDDNNGETSTNSSKILGSWVITEVNPQLNHGPQVGSELTFNADGSFINGRDKGSYTYDDASGRFTAKMNQSEMTGKFTVNGNVCSGTVTVKEGDYTESFQMKMGRKGTSDAEIKDNPNNPENVDNLKPGDISDGKETKNSTYYSYERSINIPDLGIITVKGELTFDNNKLTGGKFYSIFPTKDAAAAEWADYDLSNEDAKYNTYDGDKTIVTTLPPQQIKDMNQVSREQLQNLVKEEIDHIIMEIAQSLEGGNEPDENMNAKVSDTRMVGTWQIMTDEQDEASIGQTATFKSDGTWTMGNQSGTYEANKMSDGRISFNIYINGRRIETGKLVLVSDGNVLNGEYKLEGGNDNEYYGLVMKKPSYTYPTGGILGRWEMVRCSIEQAPLGKTFVFGNNDEMYIEGDPHIDSYKYTNGVLIMTFSGEGEPVIQGAVTIANGNATLQGSATVNGQTMAIEALLQKK